jgi:SPP1 gp7 family putative phage head morphogenesis protein
MAADNPTKTRGIEARWRKDINRRWARFMRSIIDELERLNTGADVMPTQSVITNAALDLNPTQTRSYMVFVKSEINRLLMGTNEPPNWQAQYQIDAYKKSLENFSAALKRQGETAVANQLEIEAASQIEAFTATQTLGLTAPSANPIHRDALEFLFTRSYESLDGWTTKLATEVSGIVFDSVAQGRGFEETTRLIRQRGEVSKSRAKLIAQTEVNQAYGVAQTEQAKRAEEIIGEPVMLRWLTVRDSRVRHLHATWHGTLADAKESQRKKNVSPFNCRCALAPVVEGADTPAKKEKFKAEREELIALEKPTKTKAKPKAKAKAKAKPKPKAKAKTVKPVKVKPAKPKKKPIPKKKAKPKGKQKKTGNKDLDKVIAGADTKQTGQWLGKSLENTRHSNLIRATGSPAWLTKSEVKSIYGNAWVNRAFFVPDRKAIYMANYKINDAEGLSVYRHEYGHTVDKAVTMKGSAASYVSRSVEYDDAVKRVEKSLVKKDKAFYKKNKGDFSPKYSSGASKELFSAVSAGERLTLKEKFIRLPDNKGMTFRDFLIEDALENLDDDGIGKKLLLKALAVEKERRKKTAVLFSSEYLTEQQISKLLTAEKFNYPHYYIDSLYNDWNAYDLYNSGMVADLVGAATGNKWGGGHDLPYYKSKAITIFHKGKNRTIRQGNNTEAFANVFSLENAPADELGDLGRQLANEYTKELVDILDELEVNAK